MKIIYRQKKFILSRNAKQRRYLIRSLATHLILHERIKTTYAKAYHMQPTVEDLISKMKSSLETNDIRQISQLKSMMETQEAKDKLINEIIPRMQEKKGPFTNIVKLDHRKGDNALTAYIELWGNPIAEYEREQREAKIASGEIIDEKIYELKLLNEEREFFDQEKQRLEEQLKQEKNKEQLEGYFRWKQNKKLKDIEEQLSIIQSEQNRVDFEIRYLEGQKNACYLRKYQQLMLKRDLGFFNFEWLDFPLWESFGIVGGLLLLTQFQETEQFRILLFFISLLIILLLMIHQIFKQQRIVSINQKIFTQQKVNQKMQFNFQQGWDDFDKEIERIQDNQIEENEGNYDLFYIEKKNPSEYFQPKEQLEISKKWEQQEEVNYKDFKQNIFTLPNMAKQMKSQVEEKQASIFNINKDQISQNQEKKPIIQSSNNTPLMSIFSQPQQSQQPKSQMLFQQPQKPQQNELQPMQLQSQKQQYSQPQQQLSQSQPQQTLPQQKSQQQQSQPLFPFTQNPIQQPTLLNQEQNKSQPIFQQQPQHPIQQNVDQPKNIFNTLSQQKLESKIQATYINMPLKRINEESPQSNQKINEQKEIKEPRVLSPDETITKIQQMVSSFLTEGSMLEKTNPSQASELKQQILGVFSKLCLTVDEHFLCRVQDIVNLLQENRDKKEEYFFLMKEFVLKIFNDVRTKFNQAKVIILYHSILIQMVNHFCERITDLLLGIIFRKFPSVKGQILNLKDFTDFQDFLIKNGFDKNSDGTAKIEPSDHFINLIEGYSILYFGIIGVNVEKNAQLMERVFGPMKSKSDYSHLYLNYIDTIAEQNYWEFPYIIFVLKSYILCSSDIFEFHKDSLLSTFKRIQNEMIPKIEDYFLKNFDKEYSAISATHKKEIEIGFSVIKTILQQIQVSGQIKDRLIKYDEEVRDNQIINELIHTVFFTNYTRAYISHQFHFFHFLHSVQ